MRERPLVAIVDDDKSIRHATQDLLKAAGFSTATFEDAESFLGSASRVSAGCVVADMRMPRMTGLELVTTLREQGVKVPALLISGRPTPAIRRQASFAGIPVVEKPFLGNGLIDCIRAAVGTKPS